MSRLKTLLILGAIIGGITFSVACSSESGDINSVSLEDTDRLPDDQKNTELDKALAKMRKKYKKSLVVKNGTMYSSSDDGSRLPGQSKNIPDIDLNEEFFAFVENYLENELKIPKNAEKGYIVQRSRDPRMNAIYDDNDKGVAKGYDNNNIVIMEYETEKEDVYSNLIIVRDSNKGPWKVIHNGNSYKK